MGPAKSRVTDVLAILVGIGVILAGGVALVEAWPVGSALMLFVAGLALLPFIRVPGRGSRTVIIILAFGVAMVTPMWKSFVVHRQVQGAFRFATDAAARLTDMSKKERASSEAASDRAADSTGGPAGVAGMRSREGGVATPHLHSWSAFPAAVAGFPAKLEPVYGDGYSRDLKLKDCGAESCTLVVTLTDHDYDTSIRSRSFALWTRDGGKTWACGPATTYPLAPKDLPETCQPTGAH